MLVNGCIAKTTRSHEQSCLHEQSDEHAEALRRLRRQLEQAQRDLGRAECEQNHEAIIRLRYRIIPQLEQQIRRLVQDARPPVEISGAASCLKTRGHIRGIPHSRISHPLFPQDDVFVITLPFYE